MGLRSFAVDLLPQAIRPAPPRVDSPAVAPTTGSQMKAATLSGPSAWIAASSSSAARMP